MGMRKAASNLRDSFKNVLGTKAANHYLVQLLIPWTLSFYSVFKTFGDHRFKA
jgi:hypothetical protein